MLLKLIPTKNEPSIHFSLSFADLPPQLPAPVSWTAQLSQLMHEDLEVPATLHSLDRATGVSSLLEEVAIDVEAKEVRCLFVDGSLERISFGLCGQKSELALVAAVASIISDVRESTVEDQQVAKRRVWEKEREKAASVVNIPVIATPPPAKPGKQGKHKKQRSLFMHIFSSIGSIITPSTSSNASHSLQNRQRTAGYRNSTSVIPSATAGFASPTLPTPGSSPRARALRRAARSALVDTYRRFILDELVRRFYAGSQPAGTREGEIPSMYGLENHHRRERGGFCVWILHSMRRRALIRMEQLLDEAGPPPEEVTRFSEESVPAVCSTTMDVPLSFSDEEDEDGPVHAPFVDSEARKSCSVEAEPRAESQLECPRTSRDDLPPLPDASRRSSSSSSAGTDDSSDSDATSRSSSSMSCASTAPSSVDSELEVKDDMSVELPLTLHLPQYSPRRSSEPHIGHLLPSARHEYTQLAALRMRLNHLVLFSTSQSRVAAGEIRSRLEILAVRSRRRAWLNKALKTPLVGASGYISAGGGVMLGLATPFRSSPLARYVVTAEDVARWQSSISRSSTFSSTSSLSSAYFRSVSTSSSTTTLPPSPTATQAKVSFTPFPTSRSRIRPKLDYDALMASTVTEFSDLPDSEIQGGAMDSIDDYSQGGLVVTTREEMIDEDEDEDDGRDFDVYQEDMARAHAPARTRRHRRSMQEPMMPALPLPSIETRVAGGPHPRTGHDELMTGNNELTLALLARAHATGRRGRKSSIASSKADTELPTFLECVMQPRADAEDDQDDEAGQDIVFAHEAGGPTPPSTPTESSAAFGADASQQPRRVRTSSMVGALLRGAKGVQRSIVGGLKQQVPLQAASPLSADSLLCQPVPSTAVTGVQQPPISVPSSIPKPAPSQGAAIPVHACNRRAMDLARPPVAAAVYANVDVEMNDVEVNVHLRINDFDASYGAIVPAPPSPAGDFEKELQQQSCLSQEPEFTLAMDVPRGGGGGKRWRSRSQSRFQADCEGATHRPKLSDVFSDGHSTLH